MKKLALLLTLTVLVAASIDAGAQRRRDRLDPRENGRTTREDRRDRGDRSDPRRDADPIRQTRLPAPERRMPEYRDNRNDRNTRGGDRNQR